MNTSRKATVSEIMEHHTPAFNPQTGDSTPWGIYILEKLANPQTHKTISDLKIELLQSGRFHTPIMVDMEHNAVLDGTLRVAAAYLTGIEEVNIIEVSQYNEGLIKNVDTLNMITKVEFPNGSNNEQPRDWEIEALTDSVTSIAIQTSFNVNGKYQPGIWAKLKNMDRRVNYNENPHSAELTFYWEIEEQTVNVDMKTLQAIITQKMIETVRELYPIETGISFYVKTFKHQTHKTH